MAAVRQSDRREWSLEDVCESRMGKTKYQVNKEQAAGGKKWGSLMRCNAIR